MLLGEHTPYRKPQGAFVFFFAQYYSNILRNGTFHCTVSNPSSKRHRAQHIAHLYPTDAQSETPKIVLRDETR